LDSYEGILPTSFTTLESTNEWHLLHIVIKWGLKFQSLFKIKPTRTINIVNKQN
jgi:hypothetical protein